MMVLSEHSSHGVAAQLRYVAECRVGETTVVVGEAMGFAM